MIWEFPFVNAKGGIPISGTTALAILPSGHQEGLIDTMSVPGDAQNLEVYRVWITTF